MNISACTDLKRIAQALVYMHKNRPGKKTRAEKGEDGSCLADGCSEPGNRTRIPEDFYSLVGVSAAF